MTAAVAKLGPRVDLDRLLRPLGLISALLLWEFAARATAGSFLLAGPIAVTAYIIANADLLWRSLLITMQAALLGFILGNLVAVALAVIAILVPRIERVISGVALLFFCLPLVATGPILRVLFGPGTGPQVTLSALAVYYTTYLCLMVGLRAAPASWFDLVRSYGRGQGTELFRIRVFAALPYFIAGLQIAAPAAVLGALVGEFTGAERGLGVLVIRAMRGLDVDATWALATIAAAVSILAYWGLGALGRRLGAHPPALILAPPKQTSAPSLLERAAMPVILLLVVLAIWLGSMEGFGLNRFFAKRPADVWTFLVTAPEAGENRAVLLSAFWQTVVLTLPGYVVGLALGAALSMAVVLWPSVATTTLPVAIALRSIPIVTTAPLIVLALGRGALGTIVIVAVMIFFPTLVACLQGMRQTPGQVLDVFDSYAATRRQRLIHAQIPAMLPAFFASARMAVPAAILAATTAEWLATGIGIGSLMAMTASTSNYNMLWSAIVLLAVSASLGYLLALAVERRVLRTFATEQVNP
jgi:ABC-type nitrate/sulfonate/bicarbonate transport system permease component